MQNLKILLDYTPLEIAQTTIIVPDRLSAYNSGSVRSYLTDLFKSAGRTAAFLPQIKSLYDLAREISGFASGSEIREADFSVLLIKDKSGKVPERFSRVANRGYRKHLLKLLDLLSLENDDFSILPVESQNELQRIGLDSATVQYIYEMVRAHGYHFLGEIYRTALNKISADKSIIAQSRFLLINGGFYASIEKKLLNLLGFSAAQIAEAKACPEWMSFVDVLIDGKETEFNLSKIEYLQAATPADQVEQIVYDIADRMKKNSNLEPADFTVICQSGTTLAQLAAAFTAYKIPLAAPLQNQEENSLALALKALKLGREGDVSELTTFFNLYCSHLANIELDLKSAGEELNGADLSQIFDSQNKGKFTIDFIKDEEQRKADLEHFKSFLKIVKLYDADSKVAVTKAVTDLSAKVTELVLLFKSPEKDNSLFGFQPAIEKLFGTHITINELLDYLTEITGSSKSPEQNFDGVQLVTVKDCLRAGKICYLVDLEESKFLRWNEYNRLIDRDKYDELETKIFGRTKEQFITAAFCSIWQQQVETTIFVLPLYGEETIISTKFDHLLHCYPHRKFSLKAGKVELGEFDFGYEIKELIREKEIVSAVQTEPKELQPLSANLSFEYSADELKAALKSASNLEKFMLCPANFAAALKSEYNEINSTESFIAGQYFHDVVQEFLEFFKGQNLLCGEEFEVVKNSLVKEKNKSGFADSKIEQLLGWYLYDIEPKTPDDAFTQLAFVFDQFGLKTRLQKRITDEADKTKIYGMEKENQRIVGFLARLLCEIGPSPKSVTDSLLIELQFGNFTILPGVTIKSGYMDLVLIDVNGKIRLFDLKSGSISKYSEEMQNFQIVQLQIYREVLTRAIREQDFGCFDTIPEPTDGRKFSRLPELYRKHQQPEVIAAYLSCKDTFKVELAADFDNFSEKLALLLQENRFYPQKNHGCNYCNLQGGCDKFSPSCIDLKDYKDAGFTDSDQPYTEFPKIHCPVSKTEDTAMVNVKNVVQFAKGSNQEKAVTSIRENIVISAGAGAGKTEVLSAKYINLLLNDSVEVQNIVCITFTNKAVGEMQKRIYNRLNDCLNTGCFFSVAKDSPEQYRLSEEQLNKLKRAKDSFFQRNRISTFHAFCKQLLDRYGSLVFSEYDLESTLPPKYLLEQNLKKIVKAKHRSSYQVYLQDKLTTEENEIFCQWLKGQNFYYESPFSSSGGLLGELVRLIDKINLSPAGFNSISPEIADFQLKKNEILRIFKESFDLIKTEMLQVIRQGITLLKEGDGRIVKLQAAITQIEAESVKPFDGNSYKKNSKDSDEITEFRNKLSALKEQYDDSLYLTAKNSDDADEAVIHKALYYICAGLYQDLEEFKQQQGIIEQNDFHLRLIKLLEQDQALLSMLQKEFRYLLLDEFQDTNWLQDRLINLLFKPNENFLFIVGDLKQSIYRFQQCDNNIFMKYIRAGHRFLPFTHNYRSEPEIIDFNNWFFSENNNPNYNIFKTTARDPEFPEFAKAGKSGGNNPLINFTAIYSSLKAVKDDEEGLKQAEINQLIKIKEAEYICRTISQNSACGFGSFGILIRSYSKVEYLLEMLKKYNIPFGFTMKKGLFSRPECQEFLKLLKVVFRLVNISELEYIPRISEIGQDVVSAGSLELYPAAVQLFKHPVLVDYLTRDIEFGSRQDNLNALLEQIAEADSLFDNPAEKFFHLDALAAADENGMETTAKNAVKIMTVHSSKGLEFDNLFLINVGEKDNTDKSYIRFVNRPQADRSKPNFVEFSPKGFKSVAKGDEKEYWFSKYLKNLNDQLDEAESANLLYVALTRAKKNIFVTMLKTSEKESDGSEINWLKNIEGNLFADMSKAELELTFLGHTFKVCREQICISELPEGSGSGAAIMQIPAKPQFPEFEIKEKKTATNSKNDEGNAALELGNLVHKFMEENLHHCFISNLDIASILTDMENSKELQQKATEMIQQLISCSQFKTMVQSAESILKEQSLLLLDNASTGYGNADLLLFKGNEIQIVDYKTFSGQITDETVEKYRQQLGFYQSALAKIFTGKKISSFILFVSLKECRIIEV